MKKKTKFATLLDALTLTGLIFFIIYYIISILFNSNITTIIVTIFLTIITITTIIKLTQAKKSKSLLSHKNNEKLSKLLLALKFGNPKKIREFWLYALGKKYKTLDNKNYISISDNNKTYNLIYDFSQEELTLHQLLNLKSQIINNNQILILSTSFTDDCYTFAKADKSIILMDKNQVFTLLNTLKSFPTLKEQQTPKISYKTKFISNLNRSNTIKLLRYGLLLIIASKIVPFANYYKFFGLILLILSTISIFISQKQPTPTKVELFT